MKLDTIITLANNLKYILLDETTIEDKKYFYAAGVENDLSSIKSEYIFIEEIKKDGKIFIKEVQDITTKDYLLTVFTKNYIDYAEKISTGEEQL